MVKHYTARETEAKTGKRATQGYIRVSNHAELGEGRILYLLLLLEYSTAQCLVAQCKRGQPSPPSCSPGPSWCEGPGPSQYPRASGAQNRLCTRESELQPRTRAEQTEGTQQILTQRKTWDRRHGAENKESQQLRLGSKSQTRITSE